MKNCQQKTSSNAAASPCREDVADPSGNQRHWPLDFSVETLLWMPSWSLSDLTFILFAISWCWKNLTKANYQCNVQDRWCFLPVSAKAGRWRDGTHYLTSFSVFLRTTTVISPTFALQKQGTACLSITQSQHHKSLRVSNKGTWQKWLPGSHWDRAQCLIHSTSVKLEQRWAEPKAFGLAFGSSFFGPFRLCQKEVYQIPSPHVRLRMKGLNNNSMPGLWHHEISRICRIHKPLTRVLFPTWARKKVMARSYKRLSRELGSEFLLN